jgi:hypothetical protein
LTPAGIWEEESWAVPGLARTQALAVGKLFQQRADFGLTGDKLMVISSDGDTMHVSPRNRDGD